MNDQKEKNNDLNEILKKELDFSLYGRYALIRDIINYNRKNEQQFKILDIGGRGNLLKKFLPNDIVNYLDPNIKTNDKNYIEGDGCNIPLENQSYDWTVSADVFEHIPKEKRILFLKEHIRVAKKASIITAPFYSKTVAQAEKNINQIHKLLSQGKNHPWLKEHIENGLPDKNELISFIEKNNLTYQLINNNQIDLWELITGINHLATTYISKESKKVLENFNFFYNTEIFPNDFSANSYRKLFFIKRDNSLADLKITNVPLQKSLSQKIIFKSLVLLCEIDLIKRKSFEEKDLELQKKHQSYQKLNQAHRKLNQAHRKLEKDIIMKEKTIKKLSNTINIIKSSKFWKLRNWYLKQKNKIIK